MADVAANPDPAYMGNAETGCDFAWMGEPHHERAHVCTKRQGHDGKHRCECGTTE